MGVPILIDEIWFEDGIHSVAANLDGDKIAVGTKGWLGVYEIRREGGRARLVHIASFEIPGRRECAVTSVFFSPDGESLHIRAEDGFERELSLRDKRQGMLVEISSARVDSSPLDYVIGARVA